MSGIIAVIPYFNEYKLVFYGINLKTFESNCSEITLLQDEKLLDETLNAFKKCGFEELEAFLCIFKDGDLAQKSGLAANFSESFQRMGYKCFCCSWNSILISAAIMAFVDEHGNDEIEQETEYIFCGENDYTNFNVIKHSNYYHINYVYNNQSSHFKNVVPGLTAKKFVVSCSNGDEKQVITKKQKETQKLIIDKLASKNVIALTKNIANYISKAMVAKTLKLANGKPSKFDVANTGFQDFGIANPEIAHFMMTNFKPQKEYMKKFLIKIASNEIVPAKKTFVNFEKFENFIIFEGGPKRGFTGYSKFHAPQLGLVVTLSVDQYFKSNVEIYELSQVPKLCKSVDNVAMICLTDDTFTVATIKDGKFDKNVINNVPLVIGFIDGRIHIGNDAIKFKETHKTYIITDLIKMLKTPADEIKANPKWGFQITKDENDQTPLVEFDTFRGRRKATPTFLFAFFIQYAIKTIENVSGQMPKTTVFVSKNLNDYFKNQLMATCKSAKLNLNNIQIHEYQIVELKN